ncbi:amino acid ABC transporter substrate-binding protein [Waterburya agarophytonicola K14]|uniref:Amino acid ABC transporter substrate-binding protein n=1 Tax=Waterburya agarophytonicola KI4 TaxID=2874699 RepID=A0A964BPW5_9CYAN|nr:amino acid ABC transporter substrate-binding protein [Waterburya agarophytonicola KI4]
MIKPIFRLLLLALMLTTIWGCTERNRQRLGKSNEIEQLENGADLDNRLNTIKKRGKLICGIDDRLPGFSYKESDGSYSGISVDLCRAIAVVLFEDTSKVEFRHLNSQERFTAVASGEVDILSRNTTWTFSRDTSGGLDFPPTNFYDGQGLLVAEDSEINNLNDLNGKSVCVAANTTAENNLGIQMRKRNLAYTPITFEDTETMYRSYESQDCQVVTSDRSDLIARRTSFTNPGAHKVLDLVFSKEPLGPVIANGEPEWFDVVEWVFYATIKAEEMGINSQNIDRFAQTKNPAIRRFLGMEEDLGKNIGLSQDFAQKIIKSVGNYGEIYDRNIGKPFDLSRGENNLVKNGGLLHSPPFR